MLFPMRPNNRNRGNYGWNNNSKISLICKNNAGKNNNGNIGGRYQERDRK